MQELTIILDDIFLFLALNQRGQTSVMLVNHIKRPVFSEANGFGILMHEIVFPCVGILENVLHAPCSNSSKPLARIFVHCV